MSTPECGKFEELLQAHLDGELTAEEQVEVEAHLAACAPCRDVRAELGVVAERLGAMFAAREQAAVDVSVPGVPAAGSVASDGSPSGRAQAGATPATGKRNLGLGGPEQAHASGYRIEQEIAKGGMGTVYRAVQLSLNRPVALKVLAPRLVQDEEFVARFLREARVAATLSHPNLVQIYDVAREGDTLYYSMELVDGEDAEVMMRRDGAFAPRRAVEVALGVARALEAARQAGIVHRDVKPANVMVTKDGAVKLTDLGLAKDVETTKDGVVTMERKIIGSPNYMSPEQASDIRAATHRSDVYSLAATLLHLLTNQVPFAGGSPVEVIARVLRDPPSIPDVLPGGVRLDPALRRVLVRALEKDPAARPATAGDLALELARWLEVGGGAATETLAPPVAKEAPRSKRLMKPDSAGAHKVGRSSDAIPRQSGRVAKADTGKHRRPGANPFAFAIAAIAAALIIGVGLALLRSRDESPAPQVAPRTTMTPPPSTTTPKPTTPARPQRVTEAAPGPARTPVVAQDPEADKALAALEDWRGAEQRSDAETFRRTRDLALRYRGTSAGERAAQLRDASRERLELAWEQRGTRAHELEASERWFDAAQLYREHLAAVGQDDAPTALEAGLALRSVEAQIAVRLDGDLARVDELLARGETVEAAAVANTIRAYAGPDAGAKAQARLDQGQGGALAQKPPVAPTPAPVDPKVGPPTPTPAPADEAVALAEREKRGRALLARARELLDGGDVQGARAALERGRASLEGLASLQGDVDALVAALERGPNGLDDGGLLACAFEGKTELQDDGRLQVTWDFDAPTEAADWRALPAPRDWAARASRFLQEQPAAPPRGVTGEPWNIHRKTLVGWGYTRRRLGPAFKTDRPLTIEVDARGRQNVLVALQGGDKTTIIGMGFMLEELPVSNIANIGGEAQKYAGRISRNVEQSRKRGPSAVIAREKFLMDLEELAATPHAARDRNEFTIEVTPIEGGGHTIAIKVGRRVVAQAQAEQPERVQVQLLTMGVPVAYERLVVTGALEGHVLERMKQLAKETSNDPEALRRRVREERDAAEKEGEGGDRKPPEGGDRKPPEGGDGKPPEEPKRDGR